METSGKKGGLERCRLSQRGGYVKIAIAISGIERLRGQRD